MAARLLTALLLAALLAGCGQTSTTIHGGVLRLRVSEYVITPESARMPAGEVRIEATDRGVLVHELAIASADGHIVGRTGAIFPGHTVTSPPFALAPGSYRVYDPGANYADLGAYGSLRAVAH